MNRTYFVFSAIVLLSAFIGTEALAQRGGMRGRGVGGWGPRDRYQRTYDTATVQIINGDVVKMDSLRPMRGMSYGMHLTLKTDTGEVSVHLGPAWYINRQAMKIQPNDKIEVTGSYASFDGKPAIIAAEVKKGKETLKLRDEKGFPLWSRRGK